MTVTTTKRDAIAESTGLRLAHLFDRDNTTKKSKLYEAINESSTQDEAIDVRLTAVEATLAEAKSVADAAALKALSTTLFDDGQLVSLEDTGALYRFNDGEAVGSEDPPETYDATDGGGVYHKAVASGHYVHDPVDDVAAAKLLAGVDLVDGMLMLIKDCDGGGTRGTYIYRSAGAEVEALPHLIAVTAGGRLYDAVKYSVSMVAAETATALVQSNLDLETIRQQLGSLGGGMLGTASAWVGSDEAPATPLDHGMTLDYDGAHAEEIALTDAEMAAATTIPLTLAALNAAIVAQTTGTNALLRFVYDYIAGAYRVIGPANVDLAALAITAPAANSDISVALKTAVATGTGALFARVGRAAVDTAIAHPASNGSSHSLVPSTDEKAALNANAGLDASNYVMGVDDVDAAPRARGSIATVSGLLHTLDFADGETVTIGGALTLTARNAPALDTEFTRGVSIAASVTALCAKINDLAANPTTNVVATDLGSGEMMISEADAPGGTPVVGVGTNLALSSTCATFIFGDSNLNLRGEAASRYPAGGDVTISATGAAFLTAGGALTLGHCNWVPTTLEKLFIEVRDSTGAPKAVTDTFSFESAAPGYGGLVVASQAGGSNLVATDTVRWLAIG